MASGVTSEYRYTGLDPKTLARKKGVISALDEKSAVRHARSRGLVGVEAKESKSKDARSRLRGGSGSERQAFLRSLALVNSAVPSLTETLEISSKQVHPNSALRPAIDSLLEATSSGAETLDEAFAQQGHIWGEDVAAIVAAGLKSGNLTESLKTLVQHKQRTERIRKKVRKAFTKPLLTVVITAGLIWLSLTKAIPEAIEFAGELNTEVPTITAWAVTAGDVLSTWGMPVFLVIASVLVTLYFASQSRRYSIQTAGLWLKIPMVGPIIHGQSIALAAGVTALALTTDARILQVLEWAAGATPNKRVRKSIEDVYHRVAAGIRFGDASEGEIPILPYEFAALARQSQIGLEDNGQHWRTYAEEIAADTEERVDVFAETMSGVISMMLIAVITYISFAATAPMLNVIVELITNPDAVSQGGS